MKEFVQKYKRGIIFSIVFVLLCLVVLVVYNDAIFAKIYPATGKRISEPISTVFASIGAIIGGILVIFNIVVVHECNILAEKNLNQAEKLQLETNRITSKGQLDIRF
jgi:uncharacterized membrane protein